MKLVPISKLVPYANNARTHSPEQINKLRGSLREFGFVSPVTIDKDYGILAGHGRVAAARAEGMESVPCVFADHRERSADGASRSAEIAGHDAQPQR